MIAANNSVILDGSSCSISSTFKTMKDMHAFSILEKNHHPRDSCHP